ncbi:MAG: bifunctional adenosylcobinamide kinase/adenosylcobinamide-phosphate guanylyltransferase [Boseongicola sp.]|nr:bifunctional adenosylcobinamide kinase/adenosylcobinamide-phosphate guanylyltransferase [Boseongicola sp.]MDD9976278.1 bifunctional adenosylcobinamide kinase/adenosylcobinamide-phosphate guanylyltransferase [Boseongicola sp.]
MGGRVVLVTGGARSGKSVWAERRCAELGAPLTYIATAEPRDGEISDRIAAHIARRGAEWATLEEPRNLVSALDRTDNGGARLVDCMTLWLTNEMLADDGDWETALEALVETLGHQTSPVVLVTNEVGSGIVPDNALARAFQDAAGTVNQWLGALADEVVLVVAGQPLKIKG